MNVSTERKVIVTVLLIMILVIVIGVFTYLSVRDLLSTSAQVSQTYEVITELETALSLITDAETGQRGYVITQRKEFLEPYNQAVTAIVPRLDVLRRLTRDNQPQQDRLNKLQPLVHAKLNFIKNIIEDINENRTASAREKILSGEGRRQMDDIRQVVGEMREEERRLLALRTEAARRNANQTILATLILTAFVSLSLFALNYVIFTDLKRRKQKEVVLRERSLVDPLTQLYNQKGFLARARQEIELTRQKGGDAFLIYADLDGLKQINDTLGHQFGSQAIVQTAEILKQTFRERDVLARLGGDEFAILVVDSTKEAGERILARLANNLQRFNDESTDAYQLSLSTGIAFFNPHSTIEQWLAEADQVMYENKRQKRQPGKRSD